MPPLPQPRDGQIVRVRSKPIPFSYWPTDPGTRREKIQSTLFATDPWSLILRQVESELSENSTALSQATAFLRQAKDFYSSAMNSNVDAAKPLLLYYSFLNLAKCFSVFKSRSPIIGKLGHGLSEKLASTGNVLEGGVNAVGGPGAFALFAQALGQPAPLPPPIQGQVHPTYSSRDFLSQILVGHRLYCQGADILERFVSIDKIEIRQSSTSQDLYLWSRLFKDDLQRLGYSQQALLSRTGLAEGWRNVSCDQVVDSRSMIAIEEVATHHFPNRPSEALGEVVKSPKSLLWRSVTSNPPYRKYYVYFSSQTQNQNIVHQLLSIYLSTYFFGSITRYKPEHFRSILSGPMGTFVSEFFINQPPQFLYLLASEFLGQEVSRAAIV
jgi:hypothetical protein